MHLSRFAPTAALLFSLAASLLLPAQAQSQAAPTTRVLSRDSVVARFADAESKFIDVDGVTIHYKDQGRGPVLLLVHGTMGDLADWDAWAAKLSARYRVLRLDLPGFGLSGMLRSGNYSADRMGTLIDAFMDLMGAERFAIAGISYGGLVSFRYAATRTDRVTALILANSAGIEFGKPPAPAASTPEAAASAAARSGSIFYDAVITADDIELNLRHVLANQALVTPQLVQRKLAFQNIVGRGEESIAGRKLYERGDPLRVLAHVKAPALVLWGAANKALNPKTADAFAEAMKNACRVERKVYPTAGHLLIVDQGEASAKDALAFLDGLPGQCRARN